METFDLLTLLFQREHSLCFLNSVSTKVHQKVGCGQKRNNFPKIHPTKTLKRKNVMLIPIFTSKTYDIAASLI